MIDNRTNNKNYPLPHPENIASQDVGRIADSISMIDEDISVCDEAISSIENTVSALDERSLRIPQSLVGTVNTELQDLEPNRYIVVNSDGTGFSTVEGGGGEGGLRGEILVKRSNDNFDTMWVDPKALYKRSTTISEVSEDYNAKTNNVVILAEEIEIDNGGELPRFELTQRQVNSDVFGDSQYSYIIADEIEEHGDDESDIASKTNFGRVKIGDGIDLDDGTISVAEYSKCSKTNHGVVKIGDGINVEGGVISAREYPLADTENFGIVKLSSDFAIADEGELIVANKKDVEEIIYQAANVSVVRNNCIIIDPEYAKYRIFITEDSLINFDWSSFVQEKDLAFELEIISDGNYVIAFDADVIWTLPCAGISSGTTIISFQKKYGSSKLYAELKKVEINSILNLTPSNVDDIQPDFICGHNGGGWNACNCLSVKDYSNWMSFSNPIDCVWYIDFMRSTYVQYLEYVNGYDNWTADYFYIEGSVDKINWKRLLTRENEKPTIYTLDFHGFFRHYRIRCQHTQIRYFRWFGYSVDDNLFELKKIVPIMTANSLNGYSLTSSGTNDGALFNLTQNDTGSYSNFSVRSNGQYWIKYEIPEAAVVNMIDIGAPRGYSDRMPTWFKIEASNDGENWELLLERSSLIRWYDGETRQYYINNEIVYKYYKFTPIELSTTEFRISRFRLYNKSDGQLVLENYIPTLSSSSQGGYVVTCSSELSGHLAYYAFDGNSSTQWATTSGSAKNSWIQIQFPTATLCNAIFMKARNESNFPQAPSSFEIQGSNDGTNYDILKTINTTWTQGEEKIISFFNEIPYLYYRIFIKEVQNNGDYAAFSTLNFGSSLRDYKKELNAYRFLIPIMTANSQDGFILTANSIYTGQKVYNPFEAFNRTISDSSSWTTKAQSGWIQVELPMPDVANILKMSGGFSNEEPESFVLMASNDEIDYVELLSVLGLTWTHNETKTWNINNETAYKIYKIDAVNTKSAYITISEIQLINHTVTKEY